jgi:hypothetical protein
MHRIGGRIRPALVLVAIGLLPHAWGLTVQRMALGDLCRNGHLIVRGTVLSSVDGTAELGGTLVPVTTYRIAVAETFKGDVPLRKDGAVVELTTLGKPGRVEADGLVRAPLPFEVPALEVGATYVLFTTRPSRSGLSTTVGLAQGCFRVVPQAGKETVANGLDNAGLFFGTPLESTRVQGPVPYDVLARAIRETLVAQGAGP